MKNQQKTHFAINPGVILMSAAGVGLGMLARGIYNRLNRYDLAGKVILITGGSRGLGLEMARLVSSKGAKVAICARNEDQLAKAEAELQATGAEVLAIRADLRDPKQALELIADVESHFGKVDVLINNAGVMELGPENVMEVPDYKEVMDSNLWSALNTIKAVLPCFLAAGQGRIVNICSIGGKIAVPHMLPYSVSKFALVGLSEGLSAELRKNNIRVTTVIPNLMRTGSPRNVSIKGDHEKEYAWFKIADSLPFLSQNSRQAAEEIVEALQNGDRHLTLTWTAKLVTVLKGLMPETVIALSQVANGLLPKSDNRQTKKGFESESAVTKGKLASMTDEAARENNELG
jgi:short-subunit dehydrogenase